MYSQLRICSYVHDSSRPDEGVRSVGHALSTAMAGCCDLRIISLADPQSVSGARRFNPDLCQFFLSFSNPGSLCVSKSMSFLARRSKCCIFAIQPQLDNALKILVKAFSPELIVVQSRVARDFFEDCGIDCRLIYHGIDRLKYTDCTNEDRSRLRAKFNIPQDRKVFLHVGPIREERGVRMFADIVSPDTCVVLIGRETTASDESLTKYLTAAGCLVLDNFLPNIEQLYQLSDMYVFPTVEPHAAIDLPLSVLEAVASGLPVIATRFRGIPDWREAMHLEDRITLVDRAAQIPPLIAKITRMGFVLRAPSILPSWGEVAESLLRIYEEILS